MKCWVNYEFIITKIVKTPFCAKANLFSKGIFRRAAPFFQSQHWIVCFLVKSFVQSHLVLT